MRTGTRSGLSVLSSQESDHNDSLIKNCWMNTLVQTKGVLCITGPRRQRGKVPTLSYSHRKKGGLEWKHNSSTVPSPTPVANPLPLPCSRYRHSLLWTHGFEAPQLYGLNPHFHSLFIFSQQVLFLPLSPFIAAFTPTPWRHSSSTPSEASITPHLHFLMAPSFTPSHFDTSVRLISLKHHLAVSPHCPKIPLEVLDFLPC